MAAAFVGCLTQRFQARPGGADGGKQTHNAQHDHDPQTKAKFILEPDRQNQKENRGKQNGKPKLHHPHKQIQQLHSASAGEKCMTRKIVPNYYTRFFVEIQDQF